MHHPCSVAGRATALLALSALIVVFLGATPGFAAEVDAGGEPCVGCAGCDNGECGEGDGSAPASHHHCCTTCCMSHAAIALPSVSSSLGPPVAEPMLTPTTTALIHQNPETLYRPPRV